MMKLSDRRKWYMSFGILVLATIGILFEIHTDISAISLFLALLGCIAIYDIRQKKHTILRNFPILGHIRFILEFFRPEIQQYFIANDHSEGPFDRETRTLIYARAKGMNATLAFGTSRDILQDGYEWIAHSMSPKHMSKVEDRIMIGGPDCKQPYLASRLNISAMSFGALSSHAIKALNLGAEKGDFYHNTGEGGLSEHHLQGGDLVYQLGTGYFGSRGEDSKFCDKKFMKVAKHDVVKMVEIKISQGAKPAHGGVLPAAKITPEIAKIRNVPLGKDVLSPGAHEMFSTPKELCYFIKYLRDLSRGKPIGFKLCLGQKDEFIDICKAMIETGITPDFITIDGAEGGTGAAPMEYVNNIGMPLNDALIFIHNVLVGYDLRDKIRLIAGGKITTGFDMIRKIALGADVCNSARGMMMAMGCIQSKQCNNNTCPVGIATQNPRLYKALDITDKNSRVYRFHRATIHSFQEIIGAIGLTNPSDLCPSMILRRTSPDTVKQYNEIYNYLAKGAFFKSKTLPEPYKSYLSKTGKCANTVVCDKQASNFS